MNHIIQMSHGRISLASSRKFCTAGKTGRHPLPRANPSTRPAQPRSPIDGRSACPDT